MIGVLSSEWLKTKRTAIRWLTFFMPVVIALCVVAYLAIRSEVTYKFVFEGYFIVWTAIIIPVGISLLSSFIIHEEELAGEFNGFLNTGVSRIKLYLGKFFILIFCMAVSTFISSLIICVGMNIIIPDEGSISLFMMASLLAVIGTLPILSIHLWVSFLWGMGASIGISMGGILMAALIGGTSLGGKIWVFVPWAWPVKMSMFPSIYFQTTLSTAISSGAESQLINALNLTGIGLIIFLVGGIIWFNRWEGRACNE
ncbi:MULTISPECIES: lantibiotic immunity ABC transporter MutG family permease subunit [unclassified Clostridioides]|uniref:lantibiotic immunity ABC transporter MutG family permease subunit n=1 Tax=unclassified Clostridioides TaxID=2635829 RepID=UPI001D0FBA03|nr:lantibiotic immunity ABC transporter MutG family permease subunit [Clostridioides sp. ES-S-0048-02]MCC0705980.1 lantibiotic immunity ABC transporter MutG family permease subunit [Clostridioides sp. ES-S-0190-01]